MKTKNIIISALVLSAIGGLAFYYWKEQQKDPRTLKIGQEVSYYGERHLIMNINYLTDTYTLKSLIGYKIGGVPYSAEIKPI